LTDFHFDLADIPTNELQAWFTGEHVVDTPLEHAE
jgi:hypothetical protein